MSSGIYPGKRRFRFLSFPEAFDELKKAKKRLAEFCASGYLLAENLLSFRP